MHGNVVKDVYINGLNNEFHVANAFADHFESVYYNSGSNNSAKVDFENELARMLCAGRQSVSSILSVELIDSCIYSSSKSVKLWGQTSFQLSTY